jgi:hypothetical protein
MVRTKRNGRKEITERAKGKEKRGIKYVKGEGEKKKGASERTLTREKI